MRLHPTQPPGSPQLHQPSAESSPRSSVCLPHQLSGCVQACELHFCSSQCLKNHPSENPFSVQIPLCSEQCGAGSQPCPLGCRECWCQPELGPCSCFIPSALISTTGAPRMLCTSGCLGGVPGEVGSDLAVHADSVLPLRATRTGNGPGLSWWAWKLVLQSRAGRFPQQWCNCSF